MGAAGYESPFLALPRSVWVASNGHAFAVRDAFPVSEGHTLVVPHRLVPDLWSLSPAERHSLWDLVDVVVDQLRSSLDPAPDGFTIGVNDGAAAGQTVAHVHVHVIPRHDGDVPDPRGGVRHVLPGRGNYLLDPAPEETTPASPVGFDESAFLQRVLALLTEGRQVANYKPALLLALVDACARRGATGPEPVSITVPELAELVIESYWPQVRPYQDLLPGPWYRLRQSTGERPTAQPGEAIGPGEARIPRAVHHLRQVASGRGWTNPSQVRLGDPGAWDQAVRLVSEALAKQPIPRLQRPGTWNAASDYPPFLYDDTGFDEAVSATWAMGMSLTLHPGVASALIRGAPLLRPAVESVWASKVASLNQLSTVEESLRAFLFGAARVDLGPVRTALRDLGVTDCFWCGGRLRREVHVDHVLPWSQFPTDALFNLVLADPGCNLDKRDTLVTPALLDRWVTRPLDPLQQAAESLLWPLDRPRTLRTAIAAYTYLPDGVPLWDGRHQHGPATGHTRGIALHTLRTAA